MSHTIEYRVRPVTRYIVTRHEDNGGLKSTRQHGEYDNATVAHEVGYALARAEHEHLGWPPGDDRMKYPDPHAFGQIGSGGVNLAHASAKEAAEKMAVHSTHRQEA